MAKERQNKKSLASNAAKQQRLEARLKKILAELRAAGIQVEFSSDKDKETRVDDHETLPSKVSNGLPSATSSYRGATAPSSSEDWARFAADLALCLSDLQEDEYLILSAKRVNYFVQFSARGRLGMKAEATSNSYIEEPEAQLTTDDYARLTQLGWHLPTRFPHEPGQEEPPDPDGSPNFFIQLSNPVDFPGLARLAVDTLRQVYGIAHPWQLKYKAFEYSGPTIRFPALRLKQENA